MTTDTLPTTTDESLDDLTKLGANESVKHYFGQITTIDDWDAAWPKGSRPVPFDAGQHRPEQRRVFITFQVTCTKQDGGTYTLDQAEITSGSKHVKTLKSLADLGIKTRVQLRSLAGQYCQLTRVPTGNTYVAKSGAKAGKEVDEQALSFLALYPDEAACKDAETAFYTPRNGSAPSQPTTPVASIDQQARNMMLKSLPMLWDASGKKADVFLNMLSGNPQYAQLGIDKDALEVKDIIEDSIPF